MRLTKTLRRLAVQGLLVAVLLIAQMGAEVHADSHLKDATNPVGLAGTSGPVCGVVRRMPSSSPTNSMRGRLEAIKFIRVEELLRPP